VSWLLMAAAAWALPDAALEAGLDRRVLLIDEAGRQIDCAMVEVQDERLIVRLDDGSLAQLPKDQVERMVDLGPAPPPPVEAEPEPEPEPEDDLGEAELERTDDDFDTESEIEDLLGIEAPAAPPEAEQIEPEPEPEPVEEARVELPEDELDLPESDAVVATVDATIPQEPVEVAEEAPKPELATDEDWDEAPAEAADAVAQLDPPITSLDELPSANLSETRGPVNAELYYKGRAQGGSLGAKTKDVRMAQNLGFVAGCVACAPGCVATTMIFALKKPEVPSGDWQDEDPLYQQGYVQAYQESAQKEAAKRAFIAGSLGTASTALVATVLVLQIY
jgi:hypothetical protein